MNVSEKFKPNCFLFQHFKAPDAFSDYSRGQSGPTNPWSQSSIKSAELQIAIGENNLFVEMFRISPGLWTGLPVHLMILPSEQTISLIRPDITVIQMAHGTMMVKAKEY